MNKYVENVCKKRYIFWPTINDPFLLFVRLSFTIRQRYFHSWKYIDLKLRENITFVKLLTSYIFDLLSKVYIFLGVVFFKLLVIMVGRLLRNISCSTYILSYYCFVVVKTSTAKYIGAEISHDVL